MINKLSSVFIGYTLEKDFSLSNPWSQRKIHVTEKIQSKLTNMADGVHDFNCEQKLNHYDITLLKERHDINKYYKIFRDKTKVSISSGYLVQEIVSLQSIVARTARQWLGQYVTYICPSTFFPRLRHLMLQQIILISLFMLMRYPFFASIILV